MFVSPEVSKAFYVIKNRLQFFYIKVMAYDGTELIPSQLPFIYVLTKHPDGQEFNLHRR